jgi:hypothetical protein
MREPTILRERGYANVSAGRPFIFLRYLRPDGSPYYKNKDPYELVRFLGDVKMWRGEKAPPKAISPGGRPPVLHFEPIGGGRDWGSLPDGTVVLHVESLIKAKVVHKWLPDNPCVGLNGVWGWTSSKMGVELTYADTGVDFTRFKNVILFDSNTHKPDVARARHSLAFKLRNVLGCKEVYLAELPRPSKLEYDDPDWGPDDFLRVKADPNQLVDVINAATPFVGSLDDPLIEAIKDKIVYCTSTSSVIDREFKDVMDTTHAKERYSTINRKELVGKSTKITYAFKLWQDDAEARREVRAPCYRYLGEEFVEKGDGDYYNLYVKSGVWPIGEVGERTGAADAMIAQIHNMLGDEGAYRFRTYFRFLKFNPNKPCTFLVLYGKRGHGKGWSTKIAHRLIGNANTSVTRGKELDNNFNALLGAKRLLIFNEYSVSGSYQASLNAIKGLAGDEYIVIEKKGQDAYHIENNVGAMFTTNFLNEVPTDGLEDRRLIYMELNNRVDVTPDQWEKLHSMVDDEEIMTDFAQWLWEGDDINYSTWKPDPLDHARQEAILASSGGPMGMARIILLRLRSEGYVCAWGDTILHLFEEEGYDNPRKQFAGPRLANMLAKGDWHSTGTERYGRANQQRAVFIIDQAKFDDIRGDKIAVRDEADRLHKDKVIPAKF